MKAYADLADLVRVINRVPGPVKGTILVRVGPKGNVTDHDLPAAKPEPSGFLLDLSAEVVRARSLWAPMVNAHEAYAVILEELDEFKAWVWAKQSKRDPVAMRTELLHVAAMAMRAAEDLKLSSLPPETVGTR